MGFGYTERMNYKAFVFRTFILLLALLISSFPKTAYANKKEILNRIKVAGLAPSSFVSNSLAELFTLDAELTKDDLVVLSGHKNYIKNNLETEFLNYSIKHLTPELLGAFPWLSENDSVKDKLSNILTDVRGAPENFSITGREYAKFLESVPFGLKKQIILLRLGEANHTNVDVELEHILSDTNMMDELKDPDSDFHKSFSHYLARKETTIRRPRYKHIASNKTDSYYSDATLNAWRMINEKNGKLSFLLESPHVRQAAEIAGTRSEQLSTGYRTSAGAFQCMQYLKELQ